VAVPVVVPVARRSVEVSFSLAIAVALSVSGVLIPDLARMSPAAASPPLLFPVGVVRVDVGP
jgi:hypothetical protein